MTELKIDMTNAPLGLTDQSINPGDIYRVCGGGGGPRFQVVVAISGHTAYLLVCHMSGEIRGVTQCGLHYLDRREKIGRIELPTLLPEWF